MKFIRLFVVALLMGMTLPAAAQIKPASSPAPTASAKSSGEASVDDLIRLLENDQARADLIARLRQQAGGDAQEAAKTQEPGLARQVAEYTRAIAEQASATVNTIVRAAADIGTAVSGAGQADYSAARDVAISVLIAAGVLFASFFVLRLSVEWLQTRLANRVAGRAWHMRLVALVIATCLDLGGVAIAWGVGYLVSLELTGSEAGRMGINQTLLLNAFLAVELIKVGMRTTMEPRHPPLRFLPMGDTTSAYWYFWFARLVSLLGYAFLFVAPILDEHVSAGSARAVLIVAMLTAAITGTIIVLQNKERVRAALTARTIAGRHDMLSRVSAILGHYWHVVAILYIFGVFFVWLVNPRDALAFMLRATVQSLVAILVGGLVAGFVSRFVRIGIRLPEDVRLRLPLLETRLGAFVPRVLQVVRSLILLATILAVAQAWGLVDIDALFGSDRAVGIIVAAVSAGLIVTIGFFIYVAVSSWVEYRLNPDFGSVPTAREKTLLSLFRNAFTTALSVIILMLALAQIGVNIAPLIAGAGVLGLAIGFGAQKFVQDIITGAFIQFEDVMNEGDVVEAGGQAGVVERLTIRSVSIRSLDGTLHLIPFSSVGVVSNKMKGFSFHVAEIGVAYRESVPEVKDAMQEAFDKLMETSFAASIIGPLDMHGVTEFGDSAVMVRARIKTLPGSQWATGRAYNEIIKEVFDARGIEIPYPHLTLYMGEDKAGKAPPLRVRREGGTSPETMQDAPQPDDGAPATGSPPALPPP